MSLSNYMLTHCLCTVLMRHGGVQCMETCTERVEHGEGWPPAMQMVRSDIHSNSLLGAARCSQIFFSSCFAAHQIDLRHPRSLPIHLCESRDNPLIITCTFSLFAPTDRLLSLVPSSVLLAKHSLPPFKSLCRPSSR